MALARPDRTRLALADESGAMPIVLPCRPVVVPALVITGMFAVFAAVLVAAIHKVDFHVRDLFDLAMTLFMLFWIAGWSIGVIILGALSVLLWLPSFYRESLYLRDGRLVSALRFGPLRMLADYDVARMRNLRIEQKDGGARVSFDYGEGSRSLGDAMPQALAEKIVGAIRAAMPAAGASEASPPPAAISLEVERSTEAEAGEPLSPGSAIALVAANAVPLLGVLLWDWKLADVMVLFWAESAVVAFYALLKMAVVGRWLAIPAGAFFLAHFGAFMAMHFLFIYAFFVRGVGAAGRAPAAYDALAAIFVPLWPALLALFLSHGVSFAVNFVGRREHRGATLKGLMSAPYSRIVLMQLTVIFGGWMALLFHDATPALALLVGLKLAADLYAHRRERASGRSVAAPLGVFGP